MTVRLQPTSIVTPVAAVRKTRMVDFPTGSAELQVEHKSWLDQTVAMLRPQRDFWIYIYGFASKLAPRGVSNPEEARSYNLQLSYDRANSVARYLEKQDPRIAGRIREFSARGSEAYQAPADDNTADQRAVEAHVHLVPAPPPPPPNVDPVPSLPGGTRYARWAVAAPGGITATVLPGAVVAGNVVVFRCIDRGNETHAYVAPAAGAGASYSGPALSKLLELIKQLLGTISYSGMSFTAASAITPFNFRDLDGASCLIKSAGAGAGPGYLAAKVSVSGPVWYWGSNGKPFRATKDFLNSVDVSGKDLQLGVGASAVGGPLFRVQ